MVPKSQAAHYSPLLKQIPATHQAASSGCRRARKSEPALAPSRQANGNPQSSRSAPTAHQTPGEAEAEWPLSRGRRRPYRGAKVKRIADRVKKLATRRDDRVCVCEWEVFARSHTNGKCCAKGCAKTCGAEVEVMQGIRVSASVIGCPRADTNPRSAKFHAVRPEARKRHIPQCASSAAKRKRCNESSMGRLCRGRHGRGQVVAPVSPTVSHDLITQKASVTLGQLC